jgi:hypothetical protein
VAKPSFANLQSDPLIIIFARPSSNHGKADCADRAVGKAVAVVPVLPDHLQYHCVANQANCGNRMPLVAVRSHSALLAICHGSRLASGEKGLSFRPLFYRSEPAKPSGARCDAGHVSVTTSLIPWREIQAGQHERRRLARVLFSRNLPPRSREAPYFYFRVGINPSCRSRTPGGCLMFSGTPHRKPTFSLCDIQCPRQEPAPPLPLVGAALLGEPSAKNETKQTLGYFLGAGRNL